MVRAFDAPSQAAGFSDRLERVFDIVLAAALAVLLFPAMALVALACLIFQGRPLLYTGVRLGASGRPFCIHKFRTMRAGAESVVGARLMRAVDGVVTPLGKYLRYLKLDELPQLWNIIRGDMSFVGPRPVRPAMAEEYANRISGYGARFCVKPGLTGLAQIRGGYYCRPCRKHRYDLFYIRHRSVGYDLRLLGETVVYMVGSVTRLKIRH